MPPASPLTALVLLALICAPLQAKACAVPADSALSADDAARLDNAQTTRLRAMGEALMAESAADRAALSALFAPGGEDLTTIPDGKYRCRTLKLGGMLPLTVYGYFECAISDGGTRIEKLTGSQRFTGTLTSTDDGLTYIGALHYGDEAPQAYGADAERNQVGCLYHVTGLAPLYRLEIPEPYFESRLDVIELVGKR